MSGSCLLQFPLISEKHLNKWIKVCRSLLKLNLSTTTISPKWHEWITPPLSLSSLYLWCWQKSHFYIKEKIFPFLFFLHSISVAMVTLLTAIRSSHSLFMPTVKAQEVSAVFILNDGCHETDNMTQKTWYRRRRSPNCQTSVSNSCNIYLYICISLSFFIEIWLKWW